MARKKTGEDGSGPGAEAPARPYVVLARKYRPQTFEDLIGQEAMVRTLRNAFATGRIAQGYMLTGVRGVGKTTTARILARALNYETDTIDKPTIDMPALGRHCAEIIESRHPDVIEMDAASNTSVEDVREIIENVRYMPILARNKVFIIDEVHMLSRNAFNALLKTLEEPPEHVRFIFATTEIRKVPVTVLSRCQRFDLKRVDVPMLSTHLKKISSNEGAKIEDEAAVLIARAAGGSVRDALSVLDQAIAMGSGSVSTQAVRDMLGLADRSRVFDLMEKLAGGDVAGALAASEALHKDGADAQEILSGLAGAVHLASRLKAAGSEGEPSALSAEERRRSVALAERLSVPLLARFWQMLLKGIEEVARAPDPLAAADMVLIRIAYTSDLPPPDEIIKALGGGGARRGAATPAPATPGRQPGATLNEARGEPPRATAPIPTMNEPGNVPIFRPSAVSGSAEDEDGPPPWDGPSPDDYMEDDLIAPPPEGVGDGDDDAVPAPASGLAQVRSFGDVVALAGQRRDAKLKIHLEDTVSLVKFDAVAGSIDLFLLPGAPREIANELREKLIRWTGRRWVVMLSKHKGEPTLGEVRRAREAEELAAIKSHPAVAAVLEEFPDAKITVRKRGDIPEGETGTG
jgi:DNA polymerase-3 subunit gamma/tau